MTDSDKRYIEIQYTVEGDWVKRLITPSLTLTIEEPEHICHWESGQRFLIQPRDVNEYKLWLNEETRIYDIRVLGKSSFREQMESDRCFKFRPCEEK